MDGHCESSSCSCRLRRRRNIKKRIAKLWNWPQNLKWRIWADKINAELLKQPRFQCIAQGYLKTCRERGQEALICIPLPYFYQAVQGFQLATVQSPTHTHTHMSSHQHEKNTIKSNVGTPTKTGRAHFVYRKFANLPASIAQAKRQEISPAVPFLPPPIPPKRRPPLLMEHGKG